MRVHAEANKRHDGSVSDTEAADGCGGRYSFYTMLHKYKEVWQIVLKLLGEILRRGVM